MQDRPEQFDVGPVGHVGDIDDARRDERQVRHRTAHMQQRAAACGHQHQEAFDQPVGAVIIDHRAHEGLGFAHRIADHQFARQRQQMFHQIIKHAGLDDQAARGGAALPGGGKGALHDQRGGIGQMRGIDHHNRIVAPHFQRNDLARIGGQPAIDRQPGIDRSGEQHPVNARMRDQRLAFVRAADHQLDHVFGHACAMETGDQRLAHRRGFFRRFEHHRIACDQRGDNVAIGQVRGEIIRAEHRHHPVGFVAHGGAGVEPGVEFLLAGAFGIGLHGNIDLAHHRIDFAARFP